MKLEDLQHSNVLARPESNKKNVPDGAYNGVIRSAEFAERDNYYKPDEKRIVLILKIEVTDEEGEAVDLYIAPNYSWSSRGNMVKILEKLEALPAPGESIALDDLIDIPVQVIVENVEKDNVTYSNIMSIKRLKQNTVKKPIVKKSIKKLDKPKSIDLDDDTSTDLDDDLDALFD